MSAFFVAPIVYGDAASRERQREVLEHAIGVIRGALADPAICDVISQDRSQLAQLYQGISVELMSSILWNTLTCKHGAYDSEDEVRLLLAHPSDDTNVHVDTRVRNSEVVSFVKTRIGIREPGGIAQITVGPATSDVSRSGARQLLLSLPLDPDTVLVNSGIPYRPI